MTSLTSWSFDMPYPTSTASTTTSIPSALSIIASVTDTAYPAAATQCNRLMYSDLWFENSVGRTPVNEPFWPNIVSCCNGAPIEVWAFDGECKTFCSREAAGADQLDAEEIFKCMTAFKVDYENQVECNGCSPSISVEARGLAPVAQVVGASTMPSLSMTATPVMTTTAAVVATTASSSTTAKAGTAARSEVGALGLALLGVAMLFR